MKKSREAGIVSRNLLAAAAIAAGIVSQALALGDATSAPHFAVIDPLAGFGPEQKQAFDNAIASRKIATLPTWKGLFAIKGRQYHYHFVGKTPDHGTTTIPVKFVAIKLTVPDGPGGQTIVFDAGEIMDHIVGSPLFSPSPTLGNLQFGDAMLRVEYPDSNSDWHTLLDPITGYDTIDITAPAGTVRVKQAKSGKYFGFVEDSSIVNKPISQYLDLVGSPDVMTIFITYNSVERFAYGYHSWRWGDKNKVDINVYMYSSWMEDIDDVLGFPSPDAATLSHEVAETLHDPLISSVTREWGDPFNKNRCFDRLIEVGDAVEDAGLRKVYAKEQGAIDGNPFTFTVQNMALLPWFTREDPSSALNGAYSFPVEGILTKPAPMHCVTK